MNRLLRRGFGVLNRKLHHLETGRRHDLELPHTPLFIIGPPRCGSTLVYQVLTEAFEVAYLSNLHCRFFGAPSLVERWLRPRYWRKPSDFTSQHGVADHWAAPCECGEYWYRFFRNHPQYVPDGEADPKKMEMLRASMHAFMTVSRLPLLFKNMPCALRLIPLAEALPEALFIVMHRDCIANAHSLLEARQDIYGSVETWWSMSPPGIEELRKLLPHAQVVEQIRKIHEVIAVDREQIGQDRFLDVQYESFTRDVPRTLKAVAEFAIGHGVRLDRRDVEIPIQFSVRTEMRIDPRLYEKLVEYVSEV